MTVTPLLLGIYMPLKDLIARDLYRCTIDVDEAILSEESIRLMIAYYNAVGRLSHPVLIKLADVPGYIEKISGLREAIHIQLVIESGTRSLLRQGDPESIHYSAMDLFCDENGRITAFVADHYNGKNYASYIESKYDKISHVARFIVAGGSLYQADSTHCAIFTLSHLLTTAYDVELYEQLMRLSTMPTTEKYISLPWFKLPPKYNLSTQSFKQIISYIDGVKKEDTLSAGMESPILRRENFDKALSESLKTGPDMTVKNRRIDKLTQEYAGEAYAFMNTLTEQQLISICYSEERVRSLLNQVLDILPELEEQPLFELVFSNQALLNLLTLKGENKKDREIKESFYKLLTKPAFILLIGQGLIDAQRWFDRITSTGDGKSREIIPEKLSVMVKNSVYLDGIVNAIEGNTLTISDRTDILDLLLFKNTRPLFEIERIRALYFTGQMSKGDICSISRPDIAKATHLDGKTDSELVAFLRGSCSPASVQHAQSPLGFFAPVSDIDKPVVFQKPGMGKF